MSLVLYASLLLAPQTTPDRNPDEAVIQAAAVYLLPKTKDQKTAYYIAISSEYIRKTRGDFLAEVNRILTWEAVGDGERAKLTDLKLSLGDKPWSPPATPMPLADMKLGPWIFVTKLDFNRQSRHFQNEAGKPSYVHKQIRVDVPTYSADGAWAIVHPYSTLWGGGSGNWYEGIFVKKNAKGWTAEFDVTVITN